MTGPAHAHRKPMGDLPAPHGSSQPGPGLDVRADGPSRVEPETPQAMPVTFYGGPVGTPVRYWPGERAGAGRVSRTRSHMWALGDGTPVVAVEGYAGGIALTHIEEIR